MTASDSTTEPKDEETEKLEAAHKEIKDLENADELPTRLEDWPGGKAKFLTLGGSDDGEPYGEGSTDKLGPADVRHLPGGAVSIGGDEVDNPEDYKGEPIPGGPTDPNAPAEPGEAKKDDDAA